MVDMETLDTKPTAAILSIGATLFTFNGDGIEDYFYANVDPKDCKSLGMSVNKETVEWWSSQDKEVLKAFKDPSPKPLKESLESFSEWYIKNNVDYIWCHGAAFDVPILEFAYGLIGQKAPWKYHQVMCNRTVLNMMGIDNKKLREGTKGLHNALVDAREQTMTLVKLFENS